MRPTDLALLRVPGVPDGVPGRADRRRRGHPARPGRRRVPQPALGGAHRRVGARAAAHARATATARRRSRRTAAGWPTSAPSRAASRRSGVLPTAGGAPRRLTDHHLGAGAPVWSPDSRRLAYIARVPEAGPVRHRRGRRPGRRAAAADHHAEVPAGRRRLPRSTGAARSSCVDLPADFADDTAPGSPSRCRSPPATPTAPTSPGARTAPSWRSSPPGTSGADLDLVRDVYAIAPRRLGPAAGDRPRRGDCALPAYGPDGAASTSPPSPTWGPDGLRLRRPAGRAVPGDGRRRRAASRCSTRRCTTAATRRRRRCVADDARARRRRSARGAVELLRVPLDGGRAGDAGRRAVHRARDRRGGGVVVATVAHDRSAGELIAITPGRRRLLTEFGAALGETGRVHRMRERTATAPDGYPVHGWVDRPRPGRARTRCC